MTRKMTLEEKLVSHIQIGRPDECWPWTASTNNQGYGQFALPKKNGQGKTCRVAHRVVYEHVYGELSYDFHVDHTCHNGDSSCRVNKECRHKLCCNPAHLEAVSPLENVRRGNKVYENTGMCSKQLHYITGPESWYVLSNGRRTCRKCNSAAVKRRREAARS